MNYFHSSEKRGEKMNEKNFRYRKLSTRVAEYLKRQIFLGNYQGGDHIPEKEIADELDVSRAPVREAIQNLEKRGLLKTIPRRGSFVESFAEEDIKEIFEIRIMLEGRVLDTLIDKALLSEEDFMKLEGFIDDMVDIVNQDIKEREKVVELNEADINFHKYLWKKSKRELTRNLLDRIYNQLKLAMIVDTRLEDDLESSARDHHKIITALKNKDSEAAQKALIDHIVSFKRELMEQYKFEFDIKSF